MKAEDIGELMEMAKTSTPEASSILEGFHGVMLQHGHVRPEDALEAALKHFTMITVAYASSIEKPYDEVFAELLPRIQSYGRVMSELSKMSPAEAVAFASSLRPKGRPA